MLGSHLQQLSLAAQRGRFARVSPAPLLLSPAISSSSSDGASRILQAIGLGLPHGDQTVRAWMLLQGLAPLAEVYAKDWATTGRGRTEAMRLAFMCGQLTAAWTVSNQQLNDVDEARAFIEHQVLVNPPSMDDMNHVARLIVDTARKSRTDRVLVDRDDFCHQLHITEDEKNRLRLPAQISRMYLRFWSIGAHMVDADFFVGELKAVVKYLHKPRDHPFVISQDLTVEINDAYPTIWTNQNIIGKLAFYEALGNAKEDHYKSIIVGASLLALISLVKQGNVTEGWLESRSRRVQDELPGIDISHLATLDVVKTFCTMYPATFANDDQFFNHIMGQYSLWEMLKVNSFKWILEQSIAHNTASAGALASVIVKIKALNIDFLLLQLPFSQFQQYATLIAHLLYDKYCTILKPPVTVRQYPDLAFIGVYLDFFNAEPHKSSNKYAGKPDSMATLAYTQLIELAKRINDLAIEIEADTLDAVQVAKEFLPDFNVIEGSNNDVFITPRSVDAHVPDAQIWSTYVQRRIGARAPAAVDGAMFQNLVSTVVLKKRALQQIPMDDLDRRAVAQAELDDAIATAELEKRTTWGRRFQAMPIEAQRLRVTDLHKMLLMHESAEASALRQLSTALHELGTQKPLPLLEAARLNPGQRRCKLSVSALEALQALQIQLLPEWGADPPAINPVDSEVIDFRNYFLLVRIPGSSPSAPTTVPRPPPPHSSAPSSRTPSPAPNPVAPFSYPPTAAEYATSFGFVTVTNVDRFFNGLFTHYGKTHDEIFPLVLNIGGSITPVSYTGLAGYNTLKPKQRSVITKFADSIIDNQVEVDIGGQLPTNYVRVQLFGALMMKNFPPSGMSAFSLGPIVTANNMSPPVLSRWNWGGLWCLPLELLTPNELKLKKSTYDYIVTNYVMPTSPAPPEAEVYQALSLPSADMLRECKRLGINIPVTDTFTSDMVNSVFP